MNRKDIERALNNIENSLNNPNEYIRDEWNSICDDFSLIKQALRSALDDYVFDGKCAKCDNRIYIKNGFVRRPRQNEEK